MTNKGLLAGASAGCLFLLSVAPLPAQKNKDDTGNQETVARPLSEKELKKKQEKLRKEMMGPYKKWLNEDVVYIITDEEKKAFSRLSNDEERENFIEAFWRRRDPTPDTEENEFKEEHYRRIAYANERYASGVPGWKTDRGRIYIMFGPPDENESHPSGGTYERPIEEGGGTTSTYPFEKWRYRYIEGIGTNVEIEFVDPSMSGEYHMTMDPSEKDALLYVPGAGLTMIEQMGMASKDDRFQRTDGTHLGTGNQPLPESMDEFSRLERFALLNKPPVVKFKDLEAEVNSRIIYNLLPMQVRADFFPATNATVLSNITLQFNRKDLQFKQAEGMAKATINIYMRVTSMTRKVIQVAEDTVSGDVPNSMLQEYLQGAFIHQKQLPLPPGLYRLNVVAKDIVGGTMNNYEMALNVPRLEDDKLFASTLVLADVLEKVSTRQIGTGPFVIGSSKVRPRLGETFKPDEKMGIYMKLYNFQPDEKTQKPSGTVDFEIVKKADNSSVLKYSEDVSQLDGSASQMTVETLLPLKNLSLTPGDYELRITAKDTLRNQTVTQQAKFTVEK